MAHNRRLVLGGVALTRARNNPHGLEVMAEIMEELEPVMISTGYLDEAPFRWIGLIFRYGLKDDERPSYRRINTKYGDLPVAIELDVHRLQHADRTQLKKILTVATLSVLVHVARKFKLPCERFVQLLNDHQDANAETQDG